MNKSHKTHPFARRFAYFLAGLALMAAGYAGMRLAAPSHATAGAASHGQIVDSCLAGNGHC